MGQTLTGRYPSQDYKDLLKVDNGNAGIDATPRKVHDGLGNESALEISTSIVNIDGIFQIGGVEFDAGGVAPTSVAAFTVNRLTVVSVVSITGNVIGTSATFSDKVSVSTFAVTGITSIGGALVASSTVSAGSGIYDDKGYLRNIPNLAVGSAHVASIGDIGKYINITTGGVTIPQNVFSAGNVFSLYNNSGSTQTITQGSGVTMYRSETASTGNRDLAERGICTILCVSANEFVIAGSGLT